VNVVLQESLQQVAVLSHNALKDVAEQRAAMRTNEAACLELLCKVQFHHKPLYHRASQVLCI
jgi:hypothetical protein